MADVVEEPQNAPQRRSSQEPYPACHAELDIRLTRHLQDDSSLCPPHDVHSGNPAFPATSAFSTAYNGGSAALKAAQLDPGVHVNGGSHASILNGMYPSATMQPRSIGQPMMMERPRDFGFGAAMMPPIITTGETPMIPMPGENDSDLPARALAKRGAP